MKVEVMENDYGLGIEITPETPEEVAQLFRFTNNAKAEKPSVSLYFSSKSPLCSIWLRKINKDKQRNAISNK